LQSTPAPIAIQFDSLTSAQKQLVRDGFVRNGARPETAAQLPRMTLLLGFLEGGALSIFFASPDSADVPEVAAFGGNIGGSGIEGFIQKTVLVTMSKRETPPTALLGASLKDEKLVPEVSFVPSQSADSLLKSLPGSSLSSEFLNVVARTGKLQLIADHHTLSSRAAVTSDATIRVIMEAAAPQLQRVVRVQDGYLLARNGFWVDRDEEEIPVPLPEAWIAKKSSGGGLSLDDLGVLSQLPAPKLDGLSAYVDGAAQFRVETAVVRRNRWVFALIRSLSKAQLQRALGATGLPLKMLDLKQRSFVTQSVPLPVPVGLVRLYLTGRPGNDDAVELHSARLVAEGSDLSLWYLGVPGAPPIPTRPQ
jgi:hypothetical protein